MVNFILGGVFLYITLPILEALMSAICTRIEQYKAKCGVKIAEYNAQISQLNLGEETQVNVIGFSTQNSEEEEEIDYEED